IVVTAIEADPQDGGLVVLRFLLQKDRRFATPVAFGPAVQSSEEGGPVARLRQRVSHGFDVNSLYRPVRHAGVVEPLLEEIIPLLTRILFEFPLEIGNAQDAILIAGINDAHEVVKGGFAEAILDHADDLATAVVAHGEEIHEMPVLLHALHGWSRIAAPQ